MNQNIYVQGVFSAWEWLSDVMMIFDGGKALYLYMKL